MKRALAAMSGGVDSSVAALLLTRQGYDVTGVMMKLFENEDIGEDILSACCSLADKGDAEAAASVIDIPFYVFNYAADFRVRVMDAFAGEYARGRTPNPCVECNRHLKFGALIKKADELKCDYVATGHYARVEQGANGRYLLKRAVDLTKDQSYALHFLSQDTLSRILFPLGELTKSEAREIAAQNGLPNAKKPDSQDICFVPDGDYGAFLDAFTGAPSVPGDFVNADGAKIGTHRGYRNYTIGQRRGLGISNADRLYVTRIDAAKNVVTLGANSDLFRRTFTASNVNFIACDSLDGETKLTVKIRHTHAPQPATVRQTGEHAITVTFDEPQRAITPGQYAVMYDGDVVIGGSVIDFVGDNADDN